MKHSRISGTGSFLPEAILTNDDLADMVDTSDEWIVERTGIKHRHVVTKDFETTTYMATEAAKQALEMAALEASNIDMIIVATCTPDKFFPSTAAVVQQNLGITNAIPCFDISVACAGFVYGISIADQYIKSGQMKNILIIGSESMSKIVDWEDRRTCILFGDGAGAVVLQASDQPGIHSTHLHAQGAAAEMLSLDNLYMANENEDCFIHMDGRGVFRFTVAAVDEVVDETLKHNNLQASDIQWLIPHQANLRIIKSMAKKLKMDLSQVILTIEDHGNTSAASIPSTLDVGVRSGRIQRGDKMLLEGFGGGMAWGSALITF